LSITLLLFTISLFLQLKINILLYIFYNIKLMIWNFNEISKKFFENYFKVRSLVLTKEL